MPTVTFADHLGLFKGLRIFDRFKVSDELGLYTHERNLEYHNKTPWHKAWPNYMYLKRLRFSVPAVIVSGLLWYFVPVAHSSLITGAFQLFTFLCLIWMGTHLYGPIQAMQDSLGPYSIKLRTLSGSGDIEKLTEFRQQIPDRVLDAAAFLLKFAPESEVIIGVLHYFQEPQFPTSVRFRLKDETASCWVADEISAKLQLS